MENPLWEDREVYSVQERKYKRMTVVEASQGLGSECILAAGGRWLEDTAVV